MKKVRKSGMNRERYCRSVLTGSIVKEAPPVDVPALIREIRRVGSNVEQILKRANAIGLLDVPQLRRTLDSLNAVDKAIMDAYTTGGE